MKVKIVISILAVSWTFFIQAMKVHRDLDLIYHELTNVSAITLSGDRRTNWPSSWLNGFFWGEVIFFPNY